MLWLLLACLEEPPPAPLPDTLHLSFMAQGDAYDVALVRNDGITASGRDLPSCWYLGTATDASGRRAPAAFRTCHAATGASAPLHGWVGAGQGLVVDETASGSSTFEVRTVPAARCGVDGAPIRGLPASPRRSRPERPATTASVATRYVELEAFADSAAADKYGDDLEEEILDAINVTASVWAFTPFDVPTRLILTSLTVVDADEDPFDLPEVDGETDAYALLDALKAHVPQPSDATVLFTGRNLEGPEGRVVGLASVDATCTPRAHGLVQLRDGDGMTLAHELGHNLGAEHDDEPVAASCDPEAFIMAPSSSGATEYSSCSVEQFEDHLAFVDCLDDVPVFDEPSCGNGVVEEGEVCDCGSVGDCDPCCDEDTCQLAPEATCSGTDACCDAATCQPEPAGTECRASASECDVREQCDGVNTTCPVDEWEDSGEACVTDGGFDGTCAAGECRSREESCYLVGMGSPDDCVDSCTELHCTDLDGICDVAWGIDEPSAVSGLPCDGGLCLDGSCVDTEAFDIDHCPSDPDKTAPGQCGCGEDEGDDRDGDGTRDCLDGCPDDPDKALPLVCGCGVPDDDSDRDGLPDCVDPCPDDDVGDRDDDGVPDCLDPCPTDPRYWQFVDSDGDGVVDCYDECPDDPDKSDRGICGCGVPETCRDGANQESLESEGCSTLPVVPAWTWPARRRPIAY